MRRGLLAIIAGALALACNGLVAGPITYDLHFDAGGGNTLDGTVTTDGVVGAVSPSNITSWSFTAFGVPAFSIGDGNAGASFLCFTECGLSATLNELILDSTPNAFFGFLSPAGLGDQAVYSAGNNLFQRLYWADSSGGVAIVAFQDFALGAVPIGTARGSTGVPEPGVIALLAACLAAGFGVACKRRPEHQSAAV